MAKMEELMQERMKFRERIAACGILFVDEGDRYYMGIPRRWRLASDSC
jgi:hypothetical protein